MSKVNLSTVYKDNWPIVTQLVLETPTAKLTVDLDDAEFESLWGQLNSARNTKASLMRDGALRG